MDPGLFSAQLDGAAGAAKETPTTPQVMGAVSSASPVPGFALSPSQTATKINPKHRQDCTAASKCAVVKSQRAAYGLNV